VQKKQEIARLPARQPARPCLSGWFGQAGLETNIILR